MSSHNPDLTTNEIPTRWHRPLPARQRVSHRRRYLCLICAVGPLRSFAVSITGTKWSGRYLRAASFQIPFLFASYSVALGSPWAARWHLHRDNTRPLLPGNPWGTLHCGRAQQQPQVAQFLKRSLTKTVSLPATSKEQKYWTIPGTHEFNFVADWSILLLNYKNLNKYGLFSRMQNTSGLMLS